MEIGKLDEAGWPGVTQVSVAATPPPDFTAHPQAFITVSSFSSLTVRAPRSRAGEVRLTRIGICGSALNEPVDGGGDARELDHIIGKASLHNGSWHPEYSASVRVLCQDMTASGSDQLASGCSVSTHSRENHREQLSLIDLHS